MHILKIIGLTIFRLIEQAWLLPRTIRLAIRQRRQRVIRDEMEIERLDRIRNPSKYVGL